MLHTLNCCYELRGVTQWSNMPSSSMVAHYLAQFLQPSCILLPKIDWCLSSLQPMSFATSTKRGVGYFRILFTHSALKASNFATRPSVRMCVDLRMCPCLFIDHRCMIFSFGLKFLQLQTCYLCTFNVVAIYLWLTYAWRLPSSVIQRYATLETILLSMLCVSLLKTHSHLFCFSSRFSEVWFLSLPGKLVLLGQ